jgi:hypothetical protein
MPEIVNFPLSGLGQSSDQAIDEETHELRDEIKKQISQYVLEENFLFVDYVYSENTINIIFAILYKEYSKILGEKLSIENVKKNHLYSTNAHPMLTEAEDYNTRCVEVKHLVDKDTPKTPLYLCKLITYACEQFFWNPQSLEGLLLPCRNILTCSGEIGKITVLKFNFESPYLQIQNLSGKIIIHPRPYSKRKMSGIRDYTLNGEECSEVILACE